MVYLYNYGSSNPVNRTDPSGLDAWYCEYQSNPQECYAQATGDYLYQHLNDPLTQEQWEYAKQAASYFAIPPELVAATLATEVVYDTDPHDRILDEIALVATNNYWHFMWEDQRPVVADMYANFIWMLHEYGGAFWVYENFIKALNNCDIPLPIEYWENTPAWRTALESESVGYGWTPGAFQMHAGTADRTQQYFESTYPGMMPEWLVTVPKGLDERQFRLMQLTSDSGEIYYVAAHLRWRADQRTGRKTDHTNDLSFDDMVILYTVYRCDIMRYGQIEEFQAATRPLACGEPGQFRPFLSYYQAKLRRETH